MSEVLLLAYVFITFVTGAGCIGAVLVLARLRNDELARAFLWFYVPLTVLVLAALLLALMDMRPETSSATQSVVEYMEGVVGRYGVMLALPLFAHRVFGVRSRRADAAFTGIVLVAVAAQHVTEFGLGGSTWDARGDAAEDLLFMAIVCYTLMVAIRGVGAGVYPPLARRFLVLLAAGVPAIAFDVLIVDGPGPRLYPLWYLAVGVTVILTLVGRRSGATGVPSRDWGLSDREQEVLRLVLRGLSNREVARQLTISPNTVKTHLRAIFDKSGFRTRVALIAELRHHPDG